MKIIGIIAEYNPFHNGHAYQIKKIKEDLQADYVVVAMSGNFVQRGAPAIIDKYARTEMALSCGADLVIELPVLWATASAEYFAMAGVTLFDKMGCVDGICFGAETDDLDTLSQICDILVEEPKDYRQALSSYLKKGLSFPTARSKALYDYFTSGTHRNDGFKPDVIVSILNEPNNILAIEYLKALRRRNSSITPYVIKREGAGYHDETIRYPSSVSDITALLTNHTAFDAGSSVPIISSCVPTASATAIRKELIEQFSASYNPGKELSFDKLVSAMPHQALAILQKYLDTNTLIFSNDFSHMLCYKLLCIDTNTLSAIGDSNPDLANRISKNRAHFIKFEQYCEHCKSKDVTYTRLSRIFTHLILNITDEDYTFGKAMDYIPYLRILGFRKDASSLLKELKKHAHAPVISKLADATMYLNNDAMQLLQKDIFAADLYTHICTIKTERTYRNEFTKNIVIL